MVRSCVWRRVTLAVRRAQIWFRYDSDLAVRRAQVEIPVTQLPQLPPGQYVFTDVKKALEREARPWYTS